MSGVKFEDVAGPFSLRWLRQDPAPRSACSYCGLGYLKATRCSGCGAPLPAPDSDMEQP